MYFTIQSMASELNMYESQVVENKVEVERLSRELQEVKKKYFLQKKKEMSVKWVVVILIFYAYGYWLCGIIGRGRELLFRQWHHLLCRHRSLICHGLQEAALTWNKHKEHQLNYVVLRLIYYVTINIITLISNYLWRKRPLCTMIYNWAFY